ncbi:MAG: tetratricopeptide repeat protein [Candidatus Anammoxibacter sp.]
MSRATEIRRQVFSALDRYKLIIFIAIPVMIGIAVGITFLKTGADRKTEKAWTKLWEVSRNQTIAANTNPDDKEKTTARAINEYNYIINDISAESVSPWALFQLGNTYYESGDYDKALNTYKRFLNEDHDHYMAPFAKQSIGYTYEQKGQYQEAIDQFKKIDSEILLTQKNLDLGRCYEKLGLTQPAIDAYNKVIELEGDDNNWIRIAQYRIDALK